MAKPISDEIKKEFLEFCRERYAEGINSFSTICFEPFNAENNGDPVWEFHAANYNPEETHDICELFASVQPEFEIETHGYDHFVIVKP
jgi:hypothetical protein